MPGSENNLSISAWEIKYGYIKLEGRRSLRKEVILNLELLSSFFFFSEWDCKTAACRMQRCFKLHVPDQFLVIPNCKSDTRQWFSQWTILRGSIYSEGLSLQCLKMFENAYGIELSPRKNYQKIGKSPTGCTFPTSCAKLRHVGQQMLFFQPSRQRNFKVENIRNRLCVGQVEVWVSINDNKDDRCWALNVDVWSEIKIWPGVDLTCDVIC